jgi:hypothetical protein
MRSPEKMLKDKFSKRVRVPNDLLKDWQVRNKVIPAS